MNEISTNMDVFTSPDPVWVRRCLDILETLWGREQSPYHVETGDPLSGLILTILSQHTNDKNRDVAFKRLREAYPTWKDAAAASPGLVEKAILPAGLAPTKALRILSVLEIIRNEMGEYSLEALRSWPTGRIESFLVGLPGVGPKTAACVLLFDLGRDAFPVDTHVARVSRRIGWFPEKTTPGEMQNVLAKIVPSERHLGGHLNIIAHGRAVCRARGPGCTACPLAAMCVFAERGD